MTKDKKNNFIVIFVTCGSMREARDIVDALLRKRLAACGNIISGVESKFWWKGKIDKAKETLVMLKTKNKYFRDVEREIRRIHSYDVPEIIALPIIAGNRNYIKWLKENVT